MDVIFFFVLDVVDHHFSQVLVSHLLQSCLEANLIAETLRSTPKVLDSSLLLILGHAVPLVRVSISLTSLARNKIRQEPLLASLVAHRLSVAQRSVITEFEFSSFRGTTFEGLDVFTEIF